MGATPGRLRPHHSYRTCADSLFVIGTYSEELRMKKKITTYSGAVYILQEDGRTITGGSKELKEGHLLTQPIVGQSMMISAPERAWRHPNYRWPGVTSSYVISIEDYVPTAWERVRKWIMKPFAP